MIPDFELQQSNYRRYKRCETALAWIITIIFVLAIASLLVGCTSYPQVDANGNPASKVCDNGFMRMPTMAPPLNTVCIPKT